MTISGSGGGASKNRRRAAARDKARTLREQQRRKEKRGRVLLQGGLIVLTLAIVATVTLVIVNSIRPPSPGPQNMLSDGITIGTDFVAVPTEALAAGEEPVETVIDPEAGVLAIQIWLDYQCPFCADFEATNSEQISTLLQQGAATVEIHPVAILDSQSQGTQYSSRAANAAACVANYSPDSYFAFNSLLFESQPEEGGTGLDDAELIALTEDAAVSSASSIDSCITEGRFRPWVTDATERAVADPDLLNEDGEFGTPRVFVNGLRYTGANNDETAFAQFIAAADSEAFSEQNSTDPSASAEPTPAEPAPADPAPAESTAP